MENEEPDSRKPVVNRGQERLQCRVALLASSVETHLETPTEATQEPTVASHESDPHQVLLVVAEESGRSGDDHLLCVRHDPSPELKTVVLDEHTQVSEETGEIADHGLDDWDEGGVVRYGTVCVREEALDNRDLGDGTLEDLVDHPQSLTVFVPGLSLPEHPVSRGGDDLPVPDDPLLEQAPLEEAHHTDDVDEQAGGEGPGRAKSPKPNEKTEEEILVPVVPYGAVDELFDVLAFLLNDAEYADEGQIARLYGHPSDALDVN